MEYVIYWYAFLIAFFSVAFIMPIAVANKNKTLARMPYALRAVAWLVCTPVIVEFVTSQDPQWPAFIVLAIIFGLGVLMSLWSVHRTQDMGVSKWWCLLMGLPAINLVFILALMVVRRADPPRANAGGPATPSPTDAGSG